jgi:hypothetical protein
MRREEMKESKCRDYQCRKGFIDTNNPIQIKTGCFNYSIAYPCSICGRLHMNGHPVQNRAGNRAFFKDGHLFNIDRKTGEKVIIF